MSCNEGETQTQMCFGTAQSRGPWTREQGDIPNDSAGNQGTGARPIVSTCIRLGIGGT